MRSSGRERIPLVFTYGAVDAGHEVIVTCEPARYPMRPARLWVDPAVAERFEFVSIRVGNIEQMIESVLPCVSFSRHPDGLAYEMSVCDARNSIRLTARNKSGASSRFEAVMWCDLFTAHE